MGESKSEQENVASQLREQIKTMQNQHALNNKTNN